jgi:hypothetical protein
MSVEIIILICGISNFVFLICGYKLGSKKELLTIQKGDTVQKVNTEYKDFDEEASFVTPEVERAYEAKLKREALYGGDTDVL